MSPVTIEFPDEALSALKVSAEAAAEELRFAAAVKWYEMGRLSSGAAAQLAGVPRTVFLSRLSEYGVDTFQITSDDLRRELGNG